MIAFLRAAWRWLMRSRVPDELPDHERMIDPDPIVFTPEPNREQRRRDRRIAAARLLAIRRAQKRKLRPKINRHP